MYNLNGLINTCTNTSKSELVNVLNNNTNLRMFVQFTKFYDDKYLVCFILTERDIGNVKWSDYDRKNQKWESSCTFDKDDLKFFITDEVLRECQLPKVDEIFVDKFTETDILKDIEKLNENNENITDSYKHSLVYGYIGESLGMYGVDDAFSESYSIENDLHLFELYNDIEHTDHDHSTTIYALYNWYTKNLVAVVIHKEDGNSNDVYISDDRFIKKFVNRVLSDSDYFTSRTGYIGTLDLVQELGL